MPTSSSALRSQSMPAGISGTTSRTPKEVTFKELLYIPFHPVEYKDAPTAPTFVRSYSGAPSRVIDGVIPKPALLVSVYNQCWPNPSFFNPGKETAKQSSPDGGYRPSKEWIKSQLMSRADEINVLAKKKNGVAARCTIGTTPYNNCTTQYNNSNTQPNLNTTQYHNIVNRPPSGRPQRPQTAIAQYTSGSTQCTDIVPASNNVDCGTAIVAAPQPTYVLHDNSKNQDRNVINWGPYPDQVHSADSFNYQPGQQESTPPCKLTQGQYRRLADQARDINSNGGVRGSGFRQYYTASTGDTASKVYRSQLASSLRAFNQKKQWTPYHYEQKYSDPVRCRPVGFKPDNTIDVGTRCGSALRTTIPIPPGRPRPKSSPAIALSMHNTDRRSASSLSYYDHLGPSLAYELGGEPQLESVYGDRPQTADIDEEVQDENGMMRTSGKDDILREAGPDNDDVLLEKVNSIDADKEVIESDSDDSDDENIPEPKLEEVEMYRIPELNLRPEIIDKIYIPAYSKGDRRKYDFEMENTELPEYEFADPFSEPIMKLDLGKISQNGGDWQLELGDDEKAEDEIEEKIIDRLLEFEKLQAKSVEGEQVRHETARKEKQRQEARYRHGYQRITSAKTWREKRCCVDCLQVCCVGDCNNKINMKNQNKEVYCAICHEKHTTQSCTQNAYDAHKRGERVSLDEKPPIKPRRRPRSCTPCQKANNAKYINANNIVLGRPKSGNITYSRGQMSSKPRDLRPPANNVSTELEKDFQKLGMEPFKPPAPKPEPEYEVERPATACSDNYRTNMKGRAGIIPGKSYFSQKRLSLTDLSERKRIKSASKRKKSFKRARPKTAS